MKSRARRTRCASTSPARGERSGEAATMTMQYAVGIRVVNKADQVTVEAEDALVAALKVKATHPEAAITYVRKQNARGDAPPAWPGGVGASSRRAGPRACAGR